MAQTPLGHFRRNKFLRYGYGAFANYRLASVTRGIPNADATAGSSAPLSGDTVLTVTQTAPAAAGDPAISGRGSWPREAGTSSGNMSALRPEGGIAVSYTGVVDGIGPGVYPRHNPAVVPINATVDLAVEHGDGDSDNFVGFADTVDHDYLTAGTYTPRLEITDQMGRVSSQVMGTGQITVAADVTAPTFTAGPTAADDGATGVEMTFTADDNGTFYAVAITADDPAPSVSQVMLGLDAGGGAADASGSVAVVAATPGTLVITAALPDTFDVYIVLEDDGGNVQAAAPTLIADVIVA